jgi:5-methylcytosine-specific restriction endonuclease McrA
MQPASSPRILIIDAQGQPVRWAVLSRAARYHASGKVVTDLGENLFSMAGGFQERSGRRSEFVTSSIVMIHGRHRIPFGHAHVGITKHRLFLRDRHLCGYCGTPFADADLTVEHILPVSRGGRHEWTNVVTACRPCNARKDDRTPEEVGLTLARAAAVQLRAEGFDVAVINPRYFKPLDREVHEFYGKAADVVATLEDTATIDDQGGESYEGTVVV